MSSCSYQRSPKRGLSGITATTSPTEYTNDTSVLSTTSFINPPSTPRAALALHHSLDHENTSIPHDIGIEGHEVVSTPARREREASRVGESPSTRSAQKQAKKERRQMQKGDDRNDIFSGNTVLLVIRREEPHPHQSTCGRHQFFLIPQTKEVKVQGAVPVTACGVGKGTS